MSQPARSAAPRRRVLQIALGLFISALTLYLAFRNVDFAQVGQALLAAQPGWVGLALLSVAVNSLAKAYRWKLLLPGRPFGRLLLALLAGAMLNYFLPARLGDFSRAYAAGEPGEDRARSLGTVVLEKVFDLVAYALLFILLLLLIPLPQWTSRPALSVVLAAVVSVAVTILAVYQRSHVLKLAEHLLSWLPRSWQGFTSSRLQAGMESLDALQGAAAVVGVSCWSAVIWLAAVATNQLLLLALGVHVPWTASLLVLVVLQVGITLPSVPGRIGVFEYLCILALAVFGVAQQPALTFGLLLHGVVLLPTTLAGLVAIWLLGLQGHWSLDAPVEDSAS